jgi:6-phosphofructokinase 2
MKIVTLTLNPALDKSSRVDGIRAEQKLKCHSINYQAGGGGINVARVLSRLGIEAHCVFTHGGDNGLRLKELLINDKLIIQSISTKAWTRENLSVVDTQNGQQYRFGMPGNILTQSELNQIEITLCEILDENDILVLSGSIAQDAETNYYARLIRILAGRNIRVVLDSSGKALEEALNESVYLIKPNQRELAQLAGKDFLSNAEQEKFVLDLVKSQRVKFAVVSLGDKGAFVGSNEGIFYLSPPSVDVKSTIGAGDSMVAGLVYSILHGFSAEVMLKWGVACGAAATMSEGTDLAHKENIESILTVFNNEKGWA